MGSLLPGSSEFFVCIFVGGCDIVFERRMDREDWGKIKKERKESRGVTQDRGGEHNGEGGLRIP